MDHTSDRSLATLTPLERVGTIDLDALLTRAAEVRGALRQGRVELEPGVVRVAAEVQRLGLAIERVQQR